MLLISESKGSETSYRSLKLKLQIRVKRHKVINGVEKPRSIFTSEITKDQEVSNEAIRPP